MNKTKKSAFVSLTMLSAILFSACSLISVKTLEKNNNENNELVVDSLKGVDIAKAITSDNGTKITVNYNITPSSISNVRFNTSLTWQSAESENYETATWHADKNPLDYITYNLNQSTKTIVFSLKQPFGRQMVFTLASQANASINAKMTIDYRRKKLKDASIATSSTAFTNGESIKFNKTLPTYSIGSVGDRASDLFTIENKYYETTGHTLIDLIGQPITSGIYSKNYKYNGTDYTNVDLLRNAIAAKVRDYFYSLLTLDATPKVFSDSDLTDVLTYQYAAYKAGPSVTYLDSTNLYFDFISNYKTNFASGAGFKSVVKFDGKVINEYLFDLTVDDTYLTDIGIDDGAIVF